MFHRFRLVPVLAVWGLLVAGQSASAQRVVMPLYFDGFESYNLGSLDFNDPSGPNKGMNGDLNGNPWFGPELGGPNAIVVGAENGIMPHSGVQMIRGQNVAGADFDQDWYNLAYRLNNGMPFKELAILEWWFYDALGAGGANFKDYIALAFYDSAPTTTDAPPNFDLNIGFTQIQRLSLGAPTPNDPTGLDLNFYQARVPGATDGFNAQGYFNTPVPRTVGWHQGIILLGPQQADGTVVVFFFIDEAVALIHNSVTNYGFNVIEINTKFGTQTGYFDDITFDDYVFGQ